MKKISVNLKIYFILVLVLLNTVIFFSLYHISKSELTVAFLDVGQGDAIFIKSPSGQQMLVDGGSNNVVLRQLGQIMPFYDRSLDVVLATHTDQDHIGGLIEVLKRFKVDLFIRTNATSSSVVYQELEDLIKQKNITEIIITGPEILSLGLETKFNILFPNQNTAGWETNDSSIVGKLTYGQNSFLLTGDSPATIEKYLVGKYGNFLASDVLKVGHHGSKHSSSELFIGTILPAYSVISAGLDNRYGHPSLEVLSILNTFNSEILKTLGKGMIVFKTDGQNLNLVK
jgi:competence protein ComEC